MPGTICSPLEKLWAQRIPGLIDRPWLAAVRPGPATPSSRANTIPSRPWKVGRASHPTLAPRLHATAVALSPTAFLAEGVRVPPAFQCVTTWRATTTLAGRFTWTPSAPAPRSALARPVGSSRERFAGREPDWPVHLGPAHGGREQPRRAGGGASAPPRPVRRPPPPRQPHRA